MLSNTARKGKNRQNMKNVIKNILTKKNLTISSYYLHHLWFHYLFKDPHAYNVNKHTIKTVTPKKRKQV